MDQPPTPHRPNPVNPTANGPVPAAVTPNDTSATSTEEAPPAPAVPLTPVAWLSQNAVYLVGFVAIVGVLYYYQGISGVIKAAEVALGLSFVIFVHELGHFLAARWCDVHVQTFSLGFGPAIPGCSFRRGETLYKIAILPLGGYVAMVGEGTETDEGEDYPRSFKNKTVGQRMLIISAGVVMNMVLGFVCFIGVFYFHGDERPKGAVANVEPASPAWKAGVRSGSKITRIGGKENPNFRDLQLRVARTWFNSKIPFEFQPRPGDGPLLAVELEPRSDDNDEQPVIGVASSHKLQLFPSEFEKTAASPVPFGSPAALARVVDLPPGMVVLKASVPESNDNLSPRPGADRVTWPAVCRFLSDHPTQAVALEVKSTVLGANEKPRLVTLAVEGFRFGDTVVGTSDDAQADDNYDPLVVKALPLNPNDDPPVNPDPMVFHSRMKALAGKPLVIQVRREGLPADAPAVNILVPPSFTPTTGLVMEMGRVAGVRMNSPAAKAGVQVGDTIVRIELFAAAGQSDVPLADFTESDPARLPLELERAVKRGEATPGKKMARITVLRPKQNGQDASGEDGHRGNNRVTLDAVEWDSNWDSSIEQPMKASSPLSIPQLGVAYWIDCIVREVKPGSPAEQAGIQVGDKVTQIRWRTIGPNELQEPAKEAKDWTWTSWLKLESKRENGRLDPDEWAIFTQFRGAFDAPTFQMKVARAGAVVQDNQKDKIFEVATAYDSTWPSDAMGLGYVPDTINVKATSVWDAISLGLNESWDWVQQIYSGMRNLATGRVNFKGVGGPITIATFAFGAAEQPHKLILFLGMISINLAIINFLPIPLLDGGHMVLLTYEKIRGKPPSENWRLALAYVGIIVILLLMVSAIGLDVARLLHLI